MEMFSEWLHRRLKFSQNFGKSNRFLNTFSYYQQQLLQYNPCQ